MADLMPVMETERNATSRLLHERLCKAGNLITRTECLQKLGINTLKGSEKLLRKLRSELNFLKGLTSRFCSPSAALPKIQNQLKSSNLTYLEAVLSNAESLQNTVGIFSKFHYIDSGNEDEELVLDIEAENGGLWVKVVARNPQALHRIWLGQGQYGEKNICTLAEEYIEAAKQNLFNYEQPVVALSFANGVTFSVAKDLREKGIIVWGDIVCDPGSIINESLCESHSGDDIDSIIKNPPLKEQSCQRVNLDITTLVALVSSMTNGGCNFVFQEEILTQQAYDERKEPTLPKLRVFLDQKELFVCKTAISDFKSILKTVGGPGEWRRADELLKTVQIVDDNPSENSILLTESSSIKSRSKIIFGTGEALKAITTTANSSFVRAAGNQGLKFCVFLHPSRALSERKEVNPSKSCC